LITQLNQLQLFRSWINHPINHSWINQKQCVSPCWFNCSWIDQNSWLPSWFNCNVLLLIQPSNQPQLEHPAFVSWFIVETTAVESTKNHVSAHVDSTGYFNQKMIDLPAFQ